MMTRLLTAVLMTAVVYTPMAAAAPSELTCSDVGGVFVAHGTDGRGDCMPADPRPKCHLKPADQPDNYLAELTLDPPFPGGALSFPEAARLSIQQASNKDCWKLPPS
jgi:hypothetical protein